MGEIVQSEYNVESAWECFLEDETLENEFKSMDIISSNNQDDIPKGSEIYISTKTKIVYLSNPINLAEVFWKVPIISYHLPREGIVKKQMKFNFPDEESVQTVQDKLIDLNNVEQQIIAQIKNPLGRIKFRDIRKISIGLSTKDIVSYRSKKKSAFYNCFVLILRIKENKNFREIHVKVFNTGKLEIPGIRSDTILIKVLNIVTEILQDITGEDNLNYDINKCETVLINSNFNCGFYINRDKLLDILKYKYHIDCIFDACQYPGIQCKYYYEMDNKKCKISFMIFRTGSILIVGKCDDNLLYETYNYIKNLLITEYHVINVKNTDVVKTIIKKKKYKKRTIYID